MNKLVSGIVLALLSTGFATWSSAQATGSAAPISARERAALFPSPANIEKGRALVESSCESCHGLDGISQDENRPNLAGQRTVYLYREMLAYKTGTRKDRSMREAVAFLESDALLATAVYYASLPIPFDREAVDAAAQTHRRLDDDPLIAVKAATAGCGSCHGESGNSTIPGMPSLTSQHPAYFVASMKAYQNGARTHSMMQMLVASLDEETLGNMGLFYALQEPAGKPVPAASDPEAGREAAAGCANCHGADGNASGSDMPSLAGQDATYLVNAMQAYMNGQRTHGPMQNAMAGFDDQAIKDMAAFYVQQEPAARPVRKPLTAAQWLNRCSRCHGPQGNSTDPRYSRLAGQNRTYLVNVLKAYANGERSASIMHAMTAPLTDGIIERLAAYYATQEPRSVVYFELPCDDGDGALAR